MITPNSITNFNRSTAELGWFWLFCLSVQGKNSGVQSRKINNIIHCFEDAFQCEVDPIYVYSKTPHEFSEELEQIGLGQYDRIFTALAETVEAGGVEFLKTATVEELMGIYGVGPKTARFFILHSCRGARCVPLDTHVIKWLQMVVRANMCSSFTCSRPTNNEDYLLKEKAALSWMDKIFPDISIADADLLIWKSMRNQA